MAEIRLKKKKKNLSSVDWIFKSYLPRYELKILNKSYFLAEKTL